jgi:hypothetical protein
MKNARRTVVPILVVAALVTGVLITRVSASNRPAPVGPTTDRPEAIDAPSLSLISPALSLQRTYLNRGLNSASVPAGTWTPVENPLTFRCPGTTGKCFVTADLNIQFVPGSASNIELCPYVDGSSGKTNLPCATNVGWAQPGGFHAQHFVHTFVVTHGPHTVQAYILSGTSAGSVAYFSDVYSVYKKL